MGNRSYAPQQIITGVQSNLCGEQRIAHTKTNGTSNYGQVWPYMLTPEKSPSENNYTKIPLRLNFSSKKANSFN